MGSGANRITDGIARRQRLEKELLVVLYAMALALSFRLFLDPDLSGHLAYGLEYMRTGAVARADPYSYTARGQPWVNHEWAFEWLLARVYTWCGTAGLGWIQVMFWGVGSAVLLVAGWRSGRDVLAVAIPWGLYIAAAAPSLGIRPQLATYVLFPVLLLVMESVRGGRPGLALVIPPMFALWANLHGGFVAGLGILGVYALGAVGDAAKEAWGGSDSRGPGLRAALALCVSVPVAAAATLMNPWGAGLWRWLRVSLGSARPQIVEWLPPGANATGLAFAGLAVVTAIALWHQGRARLSVARGLVLVATFGESLLHARHIAFFAASVMVFVPGPLGDLLRARRSSRARDVTHRQLLLMRAFFATVITAFIVLAARWPPGRAFRLEINDRDPAAPYPTGAFRFIEDHEISGNMAVYFDWAQLVIFRYAPRIRVAYDGRFRTVYPEEVERAYFDFIGGRSARSWSRLLDDWPTEWVLLPAGSRAAARMRDESGWWLAYEDDMAALFGRARPGEPAPSPVIRHGPGPTLPFSPGERSS